MADMGTLHSKSGEQVLRSYMHCGTTMLVGAQCDTSYTEHRPPSNHQPAAVARVFTASAVCPMTCTQLLAANSRRRQQTYTRSTVRASRRTRGEALLSLAVLKMTGK